MYDLVIIGAGPAGLAASLYAMRKRLEFLTLSETLGGKGNYSVHIPDSEEHQAITARELITVYRSRLEYLRHSYRLDRVQSIERIDGGFAVHTRGGSTEEAKSVVVATGTKTPHLDVPGERELLGKALGTSSISYSHLLYGKTVLVIGDSDRVLQAAVELSIQTDRVMVAMLSNGTYSPTLVQALERRENVELIRDATVNRFVGAQRVETAKLSVAGTERDVSADAFFVEPHPSPNSELLRALFETSDVRLPAFDEEGFVNVDAANMTVVPGLFAAGDLTGNGFEQTLVALGEGTKAALSAYRYLLRRQQ